MLPFRAIAAAAVVLTVLPGPNASTAQTAGAPLDQVLAQNASGSSNTRQKTSRGIPQVGDRIDLKKIHVVTKPGKYGLASPPADDRYAIIANRIVRIDPTNGQILSIIRRVDAILD